MDLFVLQHIAGQQVGFFFANVYLQVLEVVIILLCSRMPFPSYVPFTLTKLAYFIKLDLFEKIRGRRLGFIQDSANQR